MALDLPSMSDYREAIEREPACLLDPVLLNGKKPSGTETGTDTAFYAFGYPGDSGVVYFIKCPSNKFYGIKCFVLRRPEPKHYYAIEDYLKERAPAFLPQSLKYTDEGIKIKNGHYPVVRMDWIEAVRLDRYLEKNLQNQNSLNNILKAWISLSQEMRSLGISHGNLEPNNIMIEGGKIRLVDCDTMYVPALEGANSPELGNKNFQHPGRKVFHFDANLDNFSDFVIYASILALSIDPQLWRFVRLSQHLLFQKSDYEQPESSEVLGLLKTHVDSRVRTLGDTMEELLAGKIEHVPALSKLQTRFALV